MDQLIGALIDFQGRYFCEITDEPCDLYQHDNVGTKSVVVVPTGGTKCSGIVPSPRDLNFNQHDNIDTNSANGVPTVGTKGSGIVTSPLCRDVNYSDKARGYIAIDSTSFQFIGPDRATIENYQAIRSSQL